MNSSIRVVNRKQTASFRMVLSIVTIVPLWLATAGTSADAQATSSPADWTEFHRDNMQRWNPYETVLGVNNVGNLQLKWKVSMSDGVRSSPAVVNGVVYVGSGAFSATGSVHALHATTGAQQWTFATGGAVPSSAAVANGVVYIGSQDGNVYALDANTGAKLWSSDVSFGLSDPVIIDGVVYVIGNYTLYALNANTGVKLWSFAVPPGGITSSPAVANGVVYFGAADSHLYALDASTGAKLWSFAAGVVSIGSPAVADGVVYVGSNENDQNVYALNASTGAKLWSFHTGQDINSTPAIANGVVFVTTTEGSRDVGDVWALNASTGALLWRFFPEGRVWGSPAVANGLVYVGTANFTTYLGTLYALNASTGAKLWSYAADGNLLSSPTIVDGVLYVGSVNSTSTNGTLYAFAPGSAVAADLFLRIIPSATTIHQGDLLTFAFPVWNLGPDVAEGEVLSSLQVPAGTTFDYVRISGTPGLGTCTHPPYGGTGQIVCHEGDGMAPNTTWTVRLTVKVTAPAGTVITANAATMSDTPDPNLANNTATVSLTVQ